MKFFQSKLMPTPGLIPPVAVQITFRDILGSVPGIFVSNSIVEKFGEKLIHFTGNKYISLFPTASLGIKNLLVILKETKTTANEIIIPAYTCPSVYYSVRAAGLVPVFADIERETLNISVQGILEKANDRTLAVIAADMFGKIALTGDLVKMVKDRFPNLFIIEDSAQVISDSSFEKSPSSLSPDFIVYSFGRAKSISTLEGGAVMTGNDKMAEKLAVASLKYIKSPFSRCLSLFIKTIGFALMINPRFYFLTKKILARKYKQDIFRLRSIQSNLNENLIYTAYQAFLGIRMLNKLPGFNSSREHKASLYSKTFAVLEGYYQPEAANHFFLRYPVICMSGIAKTRLEECLVNNNFVLSTGNYPVLSTLNIKPALFDPEFPVSSYIASNILTLPTHFFVSEKRIEELLKCIANYPS